MKLALLICFICITTHAAELWRGTLHLAHDKRMTGVVEQVTATHIRFVSSGTAYWLKIADLPAATRGQIFADATPEEKAAYTADLPRRQALLAAEQAKARAERDRAATAARIESSLATLDQDQRAEKQAQMRALQAREEERRRTAALEQIALELQLHRLNGK